jgi:hypothetical protein
MLTDEQVKELNGREQQYYWAGRLWNVAVLCTQIKGISSREQYAILGHPICPYY